MTTGATEFVDATTGASFIVVLYSKKAVVAREAALVFAPMVDRKYESDITYGGSLKIPNVSNLTTQSKNTSSNAATLYETVTETANTLTVGTWEYSAIAVESFTEQQADRDLLATYAPKQGYALGLAIDAALATLVASFTSTVGSLAQAIGYSEMLRAIQYLDDANAPATDRGIGISPAQKAEFMKLDQFVNADYSKLGDISATQKASMLGTWMGMPVYFSTHINGSNAAGHDNFVMQREAVALAVQMNNRAHKFFDVDYLATKVVVEHIHGSGIIRNDHGVWVKGA